MTMLVSTLPLGRLAPVDEPPGNFDPATNPILAKHWYGLPRKLACGHRTLGPGELARLAEFARLGISPRSAEGARR